MRAATFNGLIVNLCAFYCYRTWKARLDDNVDLRNAVDASIIWATESNGYDEGEALSKRLGWGGVRYDPKDRKTWDKAGFILHGGSAGITTSIHIDPKKWRFHEDVGHTDHSPFITAKGTTHRWATGALIERREVDQFIMNGVTHTAPWPIGKNTIKSWDRERYRQIDGFLSGLDRLAEQYERERDIEIARLGCGDFNSRHGTDPYDASIGVGKAMKDNGYTDFRLAAIKKSGSPSHIIDRGCGKGKVKVLEHNVVPDRGATDHDTAAGLLLRVG